MTNSLTCPQCGNTSDPQPLTGVPIWCTRFDKHKRRFYVQMTETPKQEEAK